MMGMYQKPKKAVGGRARSEKRDALFRLALTQTPLFPNKIKKAGEFFPAFSSGNEFFFKSALLAICLSGRITSAGGNKPVYAFAGLIHIFCPASKG